MDKKTQTDLSGDDLAYRLFKRNKNDKKKTREDILAELRENYPKYLEHMFDICATTWTNRAAALFKTRVACNAGRSSSQSSTETPRNTHQRDNVAGLHRMSDEFDVYLWPLSTKKLLGDATKEDCLKEANKNGQIKKTKENNENFFLTVAKHVKKGKTVRECCTRKWLNNMLQIHRVKG